MERAQLAALLGGKMATGRSPTALFHDDPAVFMAAFAGAVAAGGDVFLGNPAWRERERGELSRLMALSESGAEGWLMVPSGGSGGGLKFARHDGGTVEAAVRGFQRHFRIERVNSLGVLPLHHVSGLMAWMRAVMTDGTYLPWSWKELEGGRLPETLPPECCISLVPTQLNRLLDSPRTVDWLRRFRVVFVGGGPAWAALTERAAELRLPLSPCYGATETAAMATALRPEDFLRGVRGCGQPLPHASVDFSGGVVRVSGDSVHRGYFPGRSAERSWVTEDLGGFNADMSLVVLGRRDSVIVTGGKKVSPLEVEAVLRRSGQFEDVTVIGLPDPDWGEVVVACHPPGSPRMAEVEAVLAELEPHKRPKRFVAVAPWPRNAQGKIDRAGLARLASGAA